MRSKPSTFKCTAFKELNLGEKYRIVNDNKLCRNCLYVHKSPWTSKNRCKKTGCNKPHHTLLHPHKKSKEPDAAEKGQSLQLPTKQCFVNIGAVDETSTASEKYVKATFFSNYNNTEYQLNFLIVPKIVERVHNETFPREKFNIPKNIKLADPQFHVPRPIDVLLASGPTLSSFAIGQIKLGNENSKITLQKTSFGWIVAGGSMNNSPLNSVSCNVVKLDQLLERLLTTEDLDYQPVKSRDDVMCEEHYVQNTTRDSSGRYTVRLPFRSGNFELGSTRNQALHQFYALERKFKANPAFRTEYEKEMNGYVELGHMTLCEDDNDDGYYIPHHAVVKETNDTYKHRVVYNASANSTTGTSLNKLLLAGPTIQKPLHHQLLSFRTHPYVITADIEKMYRQIWIHPDDRKFQKIFWYHEGKIRTFTLNTVTFGLAKDEEHNFPRASQLLRRDFYVDDFLSGADTLDDIMAIRDEMIALLSRGGFVIRKWSSNHPSALDNIDRKIFDLDCGIQGNPIEKTLGVVWDSQRDVFTYLVNPPNSQSISSKRKLLSQVAKVFDPLGLVGPLIFHTKTLIQDCWRAKITWDESLPQDIHTKWSAVADQLPKLKEIVFPRYLGCSNPISSKCTVSAMYLCMDMARVYSFVQAIH
ncbi:uncharacterized protein LOC117180745 [Belonocnema kinseyi]|uniref:uncharacterized protein LOC117180745 n=1 Tax=Belonocnema kinseyi TaxID=2817044 RepID=UPI00143CE325|nr:uncharacterized protein LOC117180745 [Belonocnema kinseyi]